MSEYNVQDLIKNAIGEKPVAVQDVFDNLMVAKVRDEISGKRMEVANAFVADDEEVELDDVTDAELEDAAEDEIDNEELDDESDVDSDDESDEEAEDEIDETEEDSEEEENGEDTETDS